MPTFTYKVQDPKAGGVQAGNVQAQNEDEVISALQSKGWVILSVEEEKDKLAGIRKLKGGRVKGRDLVFFSEQMATLLTGGVPLVKALHLLGEHAQSKALGEALQAVTKEVSAGVSLHKALEKHPKVFTPLWVALVQAGELGGNLPQVLRQLGGYMETQENLKSKVVTAFMYPSVLLMTSLGVLAYFIVAIVPKFAEIFSTFDLKLPVFTRMIIGVSLVAQSYSYMIVGALLAGAVLWKLYLRTDAGRLTYNHIQLGIPFFGGLIQDIYVERLLSTLGSMLKSGVSILNGLSVLERVFSANLVFRNALSRIKKDVSEGRGISVSFRNTGIFPPIVPEMMWMGEEAGKLPDILDTLSHFYRDRVDQFIRRFTAIIDPILVLGVGGIVLVIVLAIFMPIFQLSQIGAGGGH